MDKLKINLDSATGYVKNVLTSLGYPDNIEVFTYTDDEGNITYSATYSEFYRGKLNQYIMPISKSNFKLFLKLGLENRGYAVNSINSFMTNEGLKFGATVNIATRGNLTRIKRRK